MTGFYHMFRLLSVLWASMALLWASDNKWAHATVAVIPFLIAHVAAENIYRRTA